MIKASLRAIAFLCTGLILSGCKMAMLDPKGKIAAEELNIMLISAGLMLLVVVPVIILSFVFAYRYREKNIKAVYAPEWAHNTKLEIIWWTIPCIIIAILGFITWKTTHTLDPYQPIASKNKTLTVQVVALDWKWLFIYPDKNIATVNDLRLPVNVPVKFEITANGPMNSFLIPQLGGQVYAMAGMQTDLHLIAESRGNYDGFSANYSGNGFSNMKFVTHVSTQKEFDDWVQGVKLKNNAMTLAAYRKLEAPSEENQPAYYSSVNKNLFKYVVMKAMMPEKDVISLCFGSGGV